MILEKLITRSFSQGELLDAVFGTDENLLLSSSSCCCCACRGVGVSGEKSTLCFSDILISEHPPKLSVPVSLLLWAVQCGRVSDCF